MADFVAENIVKEFAIAEEPLRILDSVNLELSRGQNLAIVGPSGSGKSTFLHIAGTLDHPTSGAISLEGENPEGLGEQQLAKFRNRKIGFVFQEHHLLPQLSALENVLVPTIGKGNGKSTAADVDRAKSLLENVGLAERVNHKPAKLSGGERQRVAVARAMICEPALLLADEPTGSLDQKNAQAIGDLLVKMQKSNNTILMCVTHSDKLAAQFDRRLALENGKFQEVA